MFIAPRNNYVRKNSLEFYDPEQMFKDAIPKDEIYEKTGCFMAPDGFLRMEISDADAFVYHNPYARIKEIKELKQSIFDKVQAKEIDAKDVTEEWNELVKEQKFYEARINNDYDQKNKLSYILSHEELYELYPLLLENVFVEFYQDKKDGTQGLVFDDVLSPFRKVTIHLNKSLKDDPKKLKEVLLHEIQHLIQMFHDFADGGSFINFIHDEANKVKAKQEFQKIDFKDIYKRTSEYVSSLKVEYPKEALSSLIVQNVLTHEERVAIHNYTVSKDVSTVKDAYNRYRSMLGEIEAHATAERSEMTTEERRLTKPYSSQDQYMKDVLIISSTSKGNMYSAKMMEKVLMVVERDRVNEFCVEV